VGHNGEAAPRECVPARAAGELNFFVMFQTYEA